MRFAAGDTFVLTDPGFRTEHLRVVLSDPFGDPETILTVQLNTATVLGDDTVVLHRDDHPFIRHDTFVTYATTAPMPLKALLELEAMESMKREPLFARHTPCSAALLDRIVAGALISPRTPKGVRRILQQGPPRR